MRLPATRFAGVPLALDRAKAIRVHGFLQSREYQETLATYLRRANGLTSQVQVSDEVRQQVTHNRVTTEIIVERLLQVDRPAPHNRPAASRRTTAVAAVEPQAASTLEPGDETRPE